MRSNPSAAWSSRPYNQNLLAVVAAKARAPKFNGTSKRAAKAGKITVKYHRDHPRQKCFIATDSLMRAAGLC